VHVQHRPSSIAVPAVYSGRVEPLTAVAAALAPPPVCTHALAGEYALMTGLVVVVVPAEAAYVALGDGGYTQAPVTIVVYRSSGSTAAAPGAYATVDVTMANVAAAFERYVAAVADCACELLLPHRS
jgi:hypothetical protein